MKGPRICGAFFRFNNLPDVVLYCIDFFLF